MSSKETKQTTQKIKENQQKFKKLQSNVQDLRQTVVKKVMKQISALDAEQKKAAAQQTARKRALALKGQIRGQYTYDKRQSRQVPVDGELKAGTMVFTKRCSTCHTLEAVDPKPQKGPCLGVIYNRRVGSNQNYELYSMSMLKKSFFWTPLNLYRFMKDPESLVPQTKCGLRKHPITSQTQRADLITMFRQFTAEMTFNVRLKEIQRIGYTAYQTNLKGQEEEKKIGNIRNQRQQKLDQKI